MHYLALYGSYFQLVTYPYYVNTAIQPSFFTVNLQIFLSIIFLYLLAFRVHG